MNNSSRPAALCFTILESSDLSQGGPIQKIPQKRKHCDAGHRFFLAHLSWKLNRAFLIDCRLSVRRLPVDFSHFYLILQSYWANFNHTWLK